MIGALIASRIALYVVAPVAVGGYVALFVARSRRVAATLGIAQGRGCP